MIPVIILASLAAVFLLFLFFQVWWRHSRPGPGRQSVLKPVDLDAFQNLTDPEEEQFLRVSLSPSEFRGVQRIRIRAARNYVSVLSENAGVLVEVGQSARLHPDPAMAAAGQQIVQHALRLKVWCLLAVLRLNAAIIFPTILSPSSRIAQPYMVVTSMAANLPKEAAA